VFFRRIETPTDEAISVSTRGLPRSLGLDTPLQGTRPALARNDIIKPMQSQAKDVTAYLKEVPAERKAALKKIA